MQPESDRQATIQAAAERYPELQVHWDEAMPGWCRFCTPDGKEAPRAEDLFKATANAIALDFGMCISESHPPWQALLESMRDYMRQRGWDGLSTDAHCPRSLTEVAFDDHVAQFFDEDAGLIRPPDDSEKARLRELEKTALADAETRRIRQSYGCGTIRNLFSALSDYHFVLGSSMPLLPKTLPAEHHVSTSVEAASKEPEDQVASMKDEWPGRRRQKRVAGGRDLELAGIVKLVREMRADNLSHEQICKRLGNHPRPPSATWRDLTWPVAYLKHTSSVKKWISKACAQTKA